MRETPRHPAFNKTFSENLLSARFCAGGLDDEGDDDDGDAAAANTHHVPGTGLGAKNLRNEKEMVLKGFRLKYMK